MFKVINKYIEILILFIIILIFIVLKIIRMKNIESVEFTNVKAEEINKKENYEMVHEENSQSKDITNVLKEHWYSGVIIEKSDKEIVFENDTQKYKIIIDENFNYKNIRTNENIDYLSFQIGDFIDTYFYFELNYFGIIRNITGNELKNELIETFTKSSELVNPITIKHVTKYENYDIVTIEFHDLFWYELKNIDEKFELDVLVDKDTEYNSKSGSSYDINSLLNIKEDIIIKLDAKTLENQYPKVLEFYCNNK